GGAAAAQGSQPAPQGLIGQQDVMFLVEDVREVAEVELRVGGGGEVEDLLLPLVGRFVGGAARRVAVDETLRAVGLEAAFEALDLARREAEGLGGLVVAQAALEEGFADFIALDLVQGEFHLRAVHGGPPCGQEAPRYGSGVTFSLWR